MPPENDSLTALEAARLRIVTQTEQARSVARDAAHMSDDVRSVSSTVTSIGGDVTVRARATGTVERIELTEAALDLDARTLSRLVTETVKRAQREAADAAVQRMADTLGDGSPLVAATRSRVSDQFDPRTEIR